MENTPNEPTPETTEVDVATTQEGEKSNESSKEVDPAQVEETEATKKKEIQIRKRGSRLSVGTIINIIHTRKGIPVAVSKRHCGELRAGEIETELKKPEDEREDVL